MAVNRRLLLLRRQGRWREALGLRGDAIGISASMALFEDCQQLSPLLESLRRLPWALWSSLQSETSHCSNGAVVLECHATRMESLGAVERRIRH